MPRRTTFVAAAAAVAMGLALAGTAQAAEPTSYFFACEGASKYQGDHTQSWSTTAPATSFTAGGGCGSADPGLFTAPLAGQQMDFVGGGTHTGRVDAVNVELHSLLLSQARVPADMGVEAELLIDGEPVFVTEGLRATPETSSSGLTQKFTFSFSRKKPVGAPAAPPLIEDGEHEITVRFSSAFLDYQNAWVWGATEVPAGVVVNPAKLASPKIVVG